MLNYELSTMEDNDNTREDLECTTNTNSGNRIEDSRGIVKHNENQAQTSNRVNKANRGKKRKRKMGKGCASAPNLQLRATFASNIQHPLLHADAITSRHHQNDILSSPQLSR